LQGFRKQRPLEARTRPVRGDGVRG
jgi:hypothetical protein